ncbi:STAS domain-containing protein [Kitasatospora indigofera]|uniref:STAS domain-containing protein n=1 Tax=Kitasatospora indigofera TaxID=67307 RepID=UPI0032509B71
MIPSSSLLIAGHRLAGLPFPPPPPVGRAKAAAGVSRLTREGRPVLALRGELDLYTAPALTRALRVHLDRCPPGTIGLDLSGVTFCDCAGLGALLAAREHGALGGRRFRAGPMSAAAARILGLTKTGALFTTDDAATPWSPGRPTG